jgi:hypothetical protein
MNRFFITSFFALTLIVGATGAAPVAHADAGGTANGSACELVPKSGVADGMMQNGSCVTSASYISQAKSVADNSPTDFAASQDHAYDGIMIKIMTLFAWLAGVAMITLNYATYYTVVAMGNFVSQIAAIGVTWRILRDIGNIMLIFGFLAIGISVILNVNWYGGKTKMLPMLLVGAIFLNFSLFFTEAIIDTGNLFATQFYKQINGGAMPTIATLGDQGISAKIMAQLGLQTIYDATKKDQATTIFTNGSPWLIGFMGILLFIILAFVLFSLAFILIARFVMLIFLIILAPIGFAGLAIPKLAGIAKRWWDTLFEQTITAPVLMLLLYIALNVITDAQFLSGLGNKAGANGGGATWLGSVNGNIAGFAPVLISFLVAMGLLLAVTISAKKMSAFGADTVSKIGNSAKNSATKLAMSPVRYVGRTASRAAVGTGKFALNTSVGRGLNWAQNKVKTSSIGESQSGRLLATALGAGGKGFKEAQDKSVKMHKEYSKSVGEAIEQKHMPGIVDASRDRNTAASVRDTAKSAQNDITARHNAADKPFVDEVTRLKKEVDDHKASGNIIGAVNAQADLTKAEKDLTAHLAPLAGARKVEIDNADTASKAAEAALKAAVAAEKAANAALATAKKGAAIGYAQSIPKSIFDGTGGLSWAAAGKGGNKASIEILKDAFKVQTEQEKALETLKAFVTPPATSAATTTPAAPAKGGTP